VNKAEVIAACRLSREFFFENFYMIPVVGGSMKFKMRDYQRHIANEITDDSQIIGLKARQIGWTTIGVAVALYDVLFNDAHPWLFVSRTEDAAQKMLDKAKFAYQRLPGWMRNMLPALETSTQTAMIFANGSRIESVPATPGTGRGDAAWGVLMDECAFMEYAEEIWGAIEPLAYGPVMLFSTANGMGNFFHDIWLDSQREDSVWTGIFYPWSVVPTRNKDWYDHTKLSYRGREWFFYQEYPSTAQEAFAKSGRVAFPYDLLLDVFWEIEPHARYEWVIGQGAKELAHDEYGQIEVTLWKEPRVIRDDTGRPVWKPNYVVGADVAEGLDHGDLTYVTVWDANTGEQVASSKSSIPVSYLDDMLVWLAREYYDALIIVERNNAGILPLDRLYRDHWWPRLYRMDSFAQIHVSDRTPRYGWRTDKATKPKMVNDFHRAITEQAILLHDPDFLIEAQTFVADGKGSYGATEGNHDDVIMGSLVAYQGVMDSTKYPIRWTDDQLSPPTHDEVDALIYADHSLKAEDILEQPLGKREEPIKIKKTITMTPANMGL
jgi:hypothetical protein